MLSFTDLDRVFFTSLSADFWSTSNTSESIQPEAKIIFIIKIKACSKKESQSVLETL